MPACRRRCSIARCARSVHDTFNAITVDGDCSTNDCVMLLANGASGVAVDERSYDAFADAFRSVCLRLALGIVRGGEGATKLVTVNVTGAASPDEARHAAKAIANSPLVKTAIHGGDPNWGRLIAVAGRAGVGSSLIARAGDDRTDRALQGRPSVRRSGARSGRVPEEKTIVGRRRPWRRQRESSTVWTCDLSAEYVRINAEYRT